MKSFLLASFLCFFTSLIWSQQSNITQIVRGEIQDELTGQPLIGATIILSGSDPLIGATTDELGHFTLTAVPIGRQTFQVSFLGYEQLNMADVMVGSGKELVLDIMLTEKINRLETIEVVNTDQTINPMGQVSARSFTVEETRQFPAGVGDPLRLVTAYPGVISTDDEANEIIIRGNNPRGLLWKLEGIEIPSPNHFSAEGVSSGGISMFSTQVISRSDFYTGAFAPEYGNATSGVFDIHLRKGNHLKREYTFQAGLLGLDFSAEGPFKMGEGSSYLLNYRYSTLGLLDKIGISVQDENESNDFQDLSFKFNFPTKSIGTFSIFGLGGVSSFKEEQRNEFSEREDYDMGIIGISNQILLNQTTSLRTTISISGTSLKDDFFRFGNSAFSEVADFSKGYQRAAMNLFKKINSKHLLEAGITLSRLSFEFNESLLIPANDPPLDDFELFDEEGSSDLQQAYLSWKYRINNALDLVSGLHYMRFGLNKKQVLEPRASFLWKLSDRRSLSLGLGLHSRLESLEYYFGNYIHDDGSRIQNNRELGFTKSLHFVLGYQQQVFEKAIFRAETYFQRLFDVPIGMASDNELGNALSTLNVGEGFLNRPLVNAGTGVNYGLELSLERKLNSGFYYLINASIYESKYKAADGIERDTRFNGNFISSIIAGKELRVGKEEKNNLFGFNGKINFSGNKRHTPIDLALSREAGVAVRPISGLFAERLPDYFRLDVQFSFRKNKPGITTEWRLDIQNLTNNQNVLGTRFVNNSIEEITAFGLVPVLSYRVEW